MKRLYETSRLAFAFLWIFGYFVLVFVSERLSAWVGIEKSVTAPFLLGMTAFLLQWMKRNKLWGTYGFFPWRPERKEVFAPVLFLLLASANLYGGVACGMRAWELFFMTVSMVCVGFLEELLFRGFLLHALMPLGRMSAALLSSLLFGAAHFLNEAGGQMLLRTLLFAFFAAASGFFFAAFYLRSGALWPCMITHAAVNITAAFSRGDVRLSLISSAVLSILCVLCGCLLLLLPKSIPSAGENVERA